MPYEALSKADKQAYETRLIARGRTAKVAADAQDLVIEAGAHVTLSTRTARQHQIEIRQPADADELSKWIGVPMALREKPEFQSNHFPANAALENVLRRTGLLQLKIPDGQKLRQVIAGDSDALYAFRVLGQNYVAGKLPSKYHLPLYILEELNALTQSVDVHFGTWVDIVVKAGGTLEFSPPGPYSVVAHSLTVEPGGKIITNKAHVSYDCTYLTIQ
jgi:hypothetical protein